MKYSFSMVVPAPDTLSYSEAVGVAQKLIQEIGGRLSDLMPWSTRGKSGVLVFVSGTTDGVQEVLAKWLNDDVIYEYHITKA